MNKAEVGLSLLLEEDALKDAGAGCMEKERSVLTTVPCLSEQAQRQTYVPDTVLCRDWNMGEEVNSQEVVRE